MTKRKCIRLSCLSRVEKFKQNPTFLLETNTIIFYYPQCVFFVRDRLGAILVTKNCSARGNLSVTIRFLMRACTCIGTEVRTARLKQNAF